MASIRSLKQFSERFSSRPGKDIPDFADLDELSQIKAFQKIYQDTEDAWRTILRCARIKFMLGGKPEQMRSITSKLKALDAKGKRRLLGALVALERVADPKHSEWRGL
jgi:hypothetical protein